MGLHGGDDGAPSADSVVRELVEVASLGGNLLLNVSPMGDGSIPEVQQTALLGVGAWLKVHGEGHLWVAGVGAQRAKGR